MMIGSGAVSSEGTARHVEQQAAPLPQTLDYRWRFNREVLLPMADQFFEARFESEDILRRGVEDKRQIIFVGNHSGGSMSWDNVVFQALFDRVVGCEQPRLRRLIHPRLYHDSIAPFRIREWWKEMGCVEATYDNFDALLSRGERFLYLSPEGVDGLKKPTWRAKRLRPFSSSFVSMAKRHDALVVPVVIHNSQYLNPLSWTWKWLDALADKLFGWPFLPLGPALPLIFFAKFFIQAWPTRLTYEFLEPISFTGTDSLTTRRQFGSGSKTRWGGGKTPCAEPLTGERCSIPESPSGIPTDSSSRHMRDGLYAQPSSGVTRFQYSATCLRSGQRIEQPRKDETSDVWTGSGVRALLRRRSAAPRDEEHARGHGAPRP